MKADLTLIRRLVHGSTSVQENNGQYQFLRMTPFEQEVYRNDKTLMLRANASAGIRLDFMTDAASVFIKGNVLPGTSRNFYYWDIVVDGVILYHEGFESLQEHPDFAFEFKLKAGAANRVSVYFPCLVRVELTELDLREATFVQPLEKKTRMLCYGDSITQGYDVRYPSVAYANQLADAFEAEMINKAVGGAIFNPALAGAADPEFRPDLITVAYGTNDWAHCSSKELNSNCQNFFSRLTAIYPGVPTYALLPIWRKNIDQVTGAGSFSDLHECIRKICAKHPQIRILDGLKLIPHVIGCFSSDGLHPNDFGNQFIARNLLRQIPSVS